MALAAYEDRKTNTRRVVKEPGWATPHTLEIFNGRPWASDPFKGDREVPCPYGVPGDLLWVREPWRTTKGFDPLPPRDIPNNALIHYESHDTMHGMGRYRHGRFMCRWMSRTLLEVTAVRIERLQDISHADAIAEGGPPSHPSIDPISREYGYADFTQSWYAQLWDHINGAGSWDANPFVWVIVFKRVRH